MRIFIVLAAAILLQYTFSACKSSSPKTFCDTVCIKDTIKFEDASQPHQPYIYITPKNCNAFELIMSHRDMETNRKMNFYDVAGTEVNINKDKISVYLKDSSYAWLTFNDCLSGRGFIIQVPFNKVAKIRRKASAFTSFDPKYSVAPGLIAYTDKGNIFIEDMVTGKQATMTFGKELPLEYNNMHEYIDSVNITATKVWAKFKTDLVKDKEWLTKEKAIELKEP
jgi:hypothetical protein